VRVCACVCALDAGRGFYQRDPIEVPLGGRVEVFFLLFRLNVFSGPPVRSCVCVCVCVCACVCVYVCVCVE
jgi:hypothetical protein